ncbi:NAD-dependent dihydropyrimidine dehydrogenase subunit PreA [Clostridium sp. BJN0001]|uniref:NAD-dependent dihydropyrimidine dehydrogenase subunit PreA n=1 Tax=Clostridium sp. BJN0001 TaxID=2930219 RepID=UPI001FD05693|nr:NAD-dependent dihydropyrimidine dehydrogenase subunit PreA [Clostridium sp. BJN0001]
MAYEEMIIKSESGRCLLCHDAPCSKACKKGINVSNIIRSLRFENYVGAGEKLKKGAECLNCDAPCMKMCRRNQIDSSVNIREIFIKTNAIKTEKKLSDSIKVDLSVDFCGVHCENPFFLSSSVVGSNYEMVAKAFDMGWAGVAFKTIGKFVPKEVSPRFASLEKENNPFIGFKNIEQISDHTLEENITYLKKLKKNYPTKIIIASIMGQDEEEWTYLAQKMEQAGADIVECNFSCPNMTKDGLGSDVGTEPELVEKYTKAVRKGTKLPILAKMTPNITNMEIPALAAVKAGADGIAAINTIKSIMNVDLYNNFVSTPNVDGKSAVGGYSGKAVKPIALRFLYDMKTNSELKNIPISGMGGIETWKDAAEFIALGCGTIQVTTSVMQYGYRIIEDMIEGLITYMKTEGFSSVSEIIGKAVPKVFSTDVLNRNTIQYPKFNRKTCVSCGRCYLSCFDGGHQAIYLDEKTGQPILNANKCVGCQLCKLVCPTGSITAGTRVEIKKNKEN